MDSDRGWMMDEALRILQEEGFSLPDDVKETLSSFSHADRQQEDSDLSSPENRTRSTECHTKSTKIRNTETPDFDASRHDPSTTISSERQYPDRRNFGSSCSEPGWGRNSRFGPDTYVNNNGTDTESSCSVSTVREVGPKAERRQNSQSSCQESVSSLDSSVLETQLQTCSSQVSSDKTMDDVLQSHEAKTDNMKNITRDMGNKLSENMCKGLGREISTDSGIADLVSSTQPGSPISESSTYSIGDRGLVPRSNVQTTAKRDSTSTYQDGKSQKSIKRDDTSIESTDVENASKGIFMTKAEQVCGNIDGVDTIESHQSSSAAMTATGTASKLKTEEKGGQLITNAEFEGDSRLARQESSQSTIETNDAKLTKLEDVKQEIQSKISESTHTSQGTSGNNSSDATTVSTSKQEKTNKESINKSVSESKTAPDGSTTNVSKTEDTKSIASSFSGKSSLQETKGGKTQTRSLSKQSSSESTTKNMSESKTYSSTSTDDTLTDVDRVVRPELTAGDSFTKTYDLGTDGLNGYNYLERRNSGGSEMSRQSSTASSIASSASALYEREQQKKRQKEAEEFAKNRKLEDHRGSVDSITKAKQVVNSKYDRNGSAPLFVQNRPGLSETDQSGGRNRERIHQNAPRSEGMFSSFSDDVFIEETPTHRNRNVVSQQPTMRDQKYDRSTDDFRNRRATLQGDIVLTEREVFKTRDEIRSNPRGRDDSFISSHNESYYSSKDKIPGLNGKSRDKRFVDSDVIEREVIQETMSEEGILFGDDDDFFGSSDEFFRGFKSMSNKMGNRRNFDNIFEHDSLFSRKPKSRSTNPYTTREDLSIDPSHDRLAGTNTYRRRQMDSDAMSDSALRSSEDLDRGALNKSRYGYSESDFDDGASVRSLPPRSDPRSRGTMESLNQRLNVTSDPSKNYVQEYINRSVPVPSYEQTMNRLHSNSSYPSLGVAADDSRSDYDYKSDSGLFSSGNASDSVFSAGKSMERNSGRSMPQNDRNYNSTVKSLSDKNLINDNSNRSRRHIDSRCYDETGMHDGGSTRRSTDISAGYASGNSKSLRDTELRQGKLESKRQDNKVSEQERAEWENRRHRIDKALSWIKSELGSLRAQDKVLTSQFQRCQDSIEQLKKQRPWYEVFSDDDEDDDRHWEDWEIDEFDRECLRERRQREAMSRKPEALISEFERVSLQERDYT